MLQLVLALGAGIATVASPCVLPVLPILLGASALPAEGRAARLRPVFIVLGFVLAFTAAALLFGAGTQALGLSQDTLRGAGVVVLALLGGLLMWPALFDRVTAPLGRLSDVAQRLGASAGTGAAGAVLLGMSLGLLWTPCAGPVLASLLALIATEPNSAGTAGLLTAYAVGAGLPMLAIAYGGQAITRRVRLLSRHAVGLRRVFGVLVLATAASLHWQVDAQAAAWLSRLFISEAQAAPAEAKPTAPEFTGLDRWFNGPPQTLAGLRGKVVLVNFWTFGCVNCLNVLPHVKQWHAAYADKGLVVVGVHTPEFAHERVAANVEAAIKRLGVKYTVAQDNRFATWNAWHNQYWPAVYLIDREGRVIYQHEGEGAYDATDQAIRDALK